MDRFEDPEEDEWLFQPAWAREPDETANSLAPESLPYPGRPPTPGAGRRRADELAAWLGPLCDAQDAMARLDARAAAAAAAVREGLCARMAFHEASGWLTHAHAWAHPLDLALRDLGLTGSFAIARVGRGAGAMPSTYAGRAHAPWEDQDFLTVARVDQVVATALRYARLLPRLAWSRDDPFATAADASALLSEFGAAPVDATRFQQWRAEFPLAAQSCAAGEGTLLPPLLAGAQVAERWMAAGIIDQPEPLPAVLAATVYLARAGRLRAMLPLVWSAYPTLGGGDAAHLPRLRGCSGSTWPMTFLHLIAEGARAGMRELERLEALAAAATARFTKLDRRSRLPDAFEAALRVPVLTPKALAARLHLVPQTATALLGDLRRAGLVREITGRRSFRAFAA